jgi:IS5 family transposase
LIQRIIDAVTQRERANAEEVEAILAALRAGVRQADVARASGYSREHLRRLAREHGIESSRPAASG